MKQEERRQIENNLMAMGLRGIDDPELSRVFAEVVNQFPGDKHWFLQGMISECEPKDRREMYDAIRPYLKFKPLALTTYECRIAEEAGAMVSQRRMRVEGPAPKPIEVGGHKLQLVPRKEDANCAWMALKCHQCEKVERFLGETLVDAATNARKAGWVRNVALEQETCPECGKTEVVN